MLQASEPILLGRDQRQRGLVPPQRLAACHALVIGVGAIGRQVALQLAALGVPRMTLFDDDTVQIENLAVQGYWPDDLYKPKVEATAVLGRRIYPQLQVQPIAERFQRSTAKHWPADADLLVFACVDKIGTRRMLWEALRDRAAFFADGRMNAEVIRILAVGVPALDEGYRKTLFGAAEAYNGPCTARSTIYTAAIAAGLLIGQMTKWLRDLPLDADFTLNLLANELSVPSGSAAL